MSNSYTIMFFITYIILSLSFSAANSDSDIWYMHQYVRQLNRKFEQKTNRFWEFEEQSNSWIEAKLPYDLVSCANETCTKVGSIDRTKDHAAETEQHKSSKKKENRDKILPQRKRFSMTKMSETSIWVTGPSGSIYERFWNGLQWVIAPHDLPVMAGYAISTFIVNQTILALSEAGNLYQMLLDENSNPIWIDFSPVLDHSTSKDTEESSAAQLISGVISNDGERIYFCTKSGSLLELSGIDPPRWKNLGRPPGANVAVIAVATSFRAEVVFTVSGAGDLYEYDQGSKPLWKKHIQKEGSIQGISLAPSKGCSSHGLIGATSFSLFLLTKGGKLVERQFQQRKWKWILHGNPQDQFLTSITCASQDEQSDSIDTLFLTTAAGLVFEYRILRQSGPLLFGSQHLHSEPNQYKENFWKLFNGLPCELVIDNLFMVHRTFKRVKSSPNSINYRAPIGLSNISIRPARNSLSMFVHANFISRDSLERTRKTGTSQDIQITDNWISHSHPLHAKVARGIVGVQFHAGRTIFPLDDGRLAELHLPGTGGENSGPKHQVHSRRKASHKYVWSILDAPETEGWNAEYCTEERGPTNCISGMKDEADEANEADLNRLMLRRRKGSNAQENYLQPSASGSSSTKFSEDYSFPDHWIIKNFRLRVMNGGMSFFLISDIGLTFEYLNAENEWFWLRHDHSTAMKGSVGNYNGSLFLIDDHGSLIIRERTGNELVWINCTAMRKGRQVIGGPPWDGFPGKSPRATPNDALFLVSKSGKLLQLTVAFRKYKWKDCRSPQTTKIACIVDQEVLRENIVFVVGRNGRLYQYNKVTELWHEHSQSKHLVLSRLPGTAMRASSLSLKGSLFMVSESGGLVEYHWDPMDRWTWIEHGTPNRNVILVGSPGPCYGSSQLLLIGSDGNVYLRYFSQGTWKWKNCGFPYVRNKDESERQVLKEHKEEDICLDEESEAGFQNIAENLQAINKNCDPKVESTRPIPFGENSVIFELRDGRLAEMQQNEEQNWEWLRIIGTPTSLNFWTALAS